jgi:hypothetical protein
VDDVMRNLIDEGDVASETLHDQPVDGGPVLGDGVSEGLQGRDADGFLLYSLHLEAMMPDRYCLGERPAGSPGQASLRLPKAILRLKSLTQIG